MLKWFTSLIAKLLSPQQPVVFYCVHTLSDYVSPFDQSYRDSCPHTSPFDQRYLPQIPLNHGLFILKADQLIHYFADASTSIH
jgi:hypothetical protein